jgi:hypothetical protein
MVSGAWHVTQCLISSEGFHTGGVQFPAKYSFSAVVTV